MKKLLVGALQLCTAMALLCLPTLAQFSDVTPPQLVELNFTPTSVDTSAGPVTVHITARVTDDLSGTVNYGWVRWVGPSGQYAWAYLQRVSGSALDGYYQGDFQVPQNAESGVWRAEIQLRDEVENWTYLQSDQLMDKGLPYALSVTSPSDNEAPRVVAMSFDPASVNVSLGDQVVTLRARIVDAMSSLSPWDTYGYIRSPSGNQIRYWYSNWQQMSCSADYKECDVAGTFTIEKDAEPGAWTVMLIRVRDSAANEKEYSTQELAAAGVLPYVTVTSATPDRNPPALRSLTFQPSLINTSESDVVLTANIGATDDRTGVSFASQYYFVGIRLLSPSGNQYRYTEYLDAPPVSGTVLDGIWQRQIRFPRFSEDGTWTIQYIALRDRVGNHRFYWPAELTQLGLNPTVTVLRPSLDTDATIPPSGGTVYDDTFATRASVTVPNNALAANTKVAIDVLTSQPNIPNPSGYTYGSYFVNVNLDPKPAMPFPPPGITLVLPLSAPLTPGSMLDLWRLDPIGGMMLAPHVNGGYVRGTVNADGTSATFTGVGRLSTVVGAVRLGPPPGDVNADGTVNCDDMNIVKAAYGKRTGQAGYDVRADLNRNGLVDLIDLTSVARRLPANTICPAPVNAARR